MTVPSGSSLPPLGARYGAERHADGCQGNDWVVPFVAVVVVAVIVWAIVYAARSSTRPREAGKAPAAERLQNIQELHRAGLITDDEHARRRAEILKDT